MARPEIKDGLTDFKYWLLGRDVAPTTAKAYASTMRSIKRDLGAAILDQQAVTDYFELARQERPTVHANMQSAWRAFAVWALETTKFEVPALPLIRKRVSTPGKSILPSSMGPALQEWEKYACKGEGFDRGHGLVLLLQTKWSAVSPDLECWGTVFKQPGMVGLRYIHGSLIYNIPREVIDTFGRWAEPRWPDLWPSKESPLVPVSPGSMQPAPLMELQRAVRAVRS